LISAERPKSSAFMMRRRALTRTAEEAPAEASSTDVGEGDPIGFQCLPVYSHSVQVTLLASSLSRGLCDKLPEGYGLFPGLNRRQGSFLPGFHQSTFEFCTASVLVFGQAKPREMWW